MVSTPSLSAVSQVALLIQNKEYLVDVCRKTVCLFDKDKLALLAAAYPPLQNRGCESLRSLDAAWRRRERLVTFLPCPAAR